MCFNIVLYRSEHLWEKHYHSAEFPIIDRKWALSKLRYTHANLKAVNMQFDFLMTLATTVIMKN